MALDERRACEARIQTIREAIGSDLGIPIGEIRSEARLVQDFGIDLFDLRELLEELEDEFEVTFTAGEEKSLRTVADIECVIRARSAA